MKGTLVAASVAILLTPWAYRAMNRPERGVAPGGSATILVRAGQDFQAALNVAEPGDVLVLEAGAVFEGPFVLPNKPGEPWIEIRSAGLEHGLPAPGTRATPAAREAMPVLQSATAPVVAALPGAHGYRFVGIEIRPRPGTFLTNLVTLGDGREPAEDLPRRFRFERCYIHGDPKRGSRRGIALNSADTEIVDSYFSDFKEVGADSQAIAGWAGPGPFRITNNLLEAAGENLLFGGADPSIPGLVPSDIEIRGNHLRKPLAWKAGEADYEGTRWSVKNLFELKNARRVVVSGNLLEHNWVDAQNGFAILFTVRNQDGGAPWSVVEDVRFENNIVRKTASAINILGHDDRAKSQQTRGIVIRHNLFVEIGDPRWGGGGRLFQVLEGTGGVVIQHNTALHAGNLVTADGQPHTGFVFEDNIALQNLYGIVGSAVAPGMPTLQSFFPGAVVRSNAIVGGSKSEYPSGNLFPPTLADVGFVDPQRADYRLAPTSPLRGAASDGGDIGADVAALMTTDASARAAAATVVGAHPRGESLGADPFAQVAFWVALLLLGYGQLGYPLLLAAVAGFRPRPVRKAADTPSLSVVIVAHDEAHRIDARLRNVLALDYPSERLEVVLASDGSTDQTAELARSHFPSVRVEAFAARRGKAAVLNEVVPACRGEIVVLADARQRFDVQALRALTAPFADPEVGAVSGELILDPSGGTAVGAGVGWYWRIEKLMRRLESRIDSTIGATGAIYAIRRELFEPLPADTILDDVLIPLRISRRGFRVVFEPTARAFDRPPREAGQEFARKVRTIAGTFQLFARERWLFSPRRNRLWVQALSHKFARLLIPALLLVAFAASALLAAREQGVYAFCFAGQVAFYAAAIRGRSVQGAKGVARLLGAAYVFCLLAWATVVGFSRFLRGTQAVTWERAVGDGAAGG